MSDGYCLIDLNSIGFAANAASKLTVAGQETQAIYGVLKTLRGILVKHPNLTPICLHDGVSWRKSVYPQYKAHRDKEAVTVHEKKAAADKAAYKRQKPHIARALKLIAVPQMIAANMEADDLAGILIKKARESKKKVVLISGDKDWLQLIGAGVSWHDPIRDNKVTPGNFAEFTQLANVRQFIELKCLIGEPGDLGPGSGVGGIGDKTGRELLNRFGSINNLLNLWIENQIDEKTGVVNGVDDYKLSKKVMAFLDENSEGRTIFARNLRLIDLNTTERPDPIQMRLHKGELDREAFTDFCGEFAFRSILSDMDGWLEPFEARLKEMA